MAEWTDPFMVGDKINVKGPSVPRELRDKFFIVRAITDGKVQLSPPYQDAACTIRYHPTYPRGR